MGQKETSIREGEASGHSVRKGRKAPPDGGWQDCGGEGTVAVASIPSRVTGFVGRIWFHFLREHWPRLCAFNTLPPGPSGELSLGLQIRRKTL